MHVTVQKRAHVFGRCGNIMLLQYTGYDPRIGHSCDFDSEQVIGNSEALPERGYEGVKAGAARMNSSAIDIQKKQAPSHFCHSERSRDILCCSSVTRHLSGSVCEVNEGLPGSPCYN